MSSQEQHKTVAEELAQAEEWMRSVVDHVLDGIITINESGTVESFNPAAERVFGYPASEVIGKNVKLLMPEPYHSEHDRYLTNYLDTGQAKIIGIGREVTGRRKDGTTFPMDLAVSGFRLGDRRYFTGIIRDITERKHAEAELKATAEELARSNIDLQQFAYVASHDLQEPLRAVAGCVQILQRRYKDQLDARADELIGHAVDGVRRMQVLINDLLAYSRVGTRGKDFEPTDCQDVLNRALTNLAVAVNEAQAVITHDQLPTVRADGTQLVQLFQNLLGNAIKFRGQQQCEIHVGGSVHVLASGCSRCATTASASSRITSSASLSFFSGCTRATSIPARGSAWPSARRSWNATGAACGSNRHTGRVRPFSSPSPPEEGRHDSNRKSQTSGNPARGR